MSFRKNFFLLLALSFCGVAKAQFISSPYSSYGLGDFAYQGLPHNYGMGETGIAMPSMWHINLQNPSMLINNSLSSFQVGLMGDIRNYENVTETSSRTSASLRFLALSFPVVRNRWSTSFALIPYSSSDYRTFSVDSITNTMAEISRSTGEGGLTQLVWANGIRMYKSLALGVKASYVFGLKKRETAVFLSGTETSSSSSIAYEESASYSDFLFSLSASYKLKLADRRYLNFGAVYDFSQTLDGEEDIVFQRLGSSGLPQQIQQIRENDPISYGLPQSVGVGLSYEYVNRVKVGADVTVKNWESVANDEVAVDLRNTMDLSLGASWIPNPQSVTSYLSRVNYRLGFSIKQSPYLVNNTAINDFGINFGTSFPVSSYSSMDAAFKFGQRGVTEDNLVKETYFQIVIGATINDQWFIKRRYD